MRVYIAGPMTSSGDILINTKRAIDVANEVRDLGHFPFVPQLCSFWHFQHARSYDDWMTYDLEWLAQCDVMIRIPGESKGADIEEKFAMRKGIPVFSPMGFMFRFKKDEDKEVQCPKVFKPWVFCNHANESSRGLCACTPDCACREYMCLLPAFRTLPDYDAVEVLKENGDKRTPPKPPHAPPPRILKDGENPPPLRKR